MRVSSSPTSPRLDTVSDGSSTRHIAPSAEIATSAASISRLSWMNASRLGLPISSSPSNMHFTLSGSAPMVAKNASATAIGMSIGPLSSDTPRA